MDASNFSIVIPVRNELDLIQQNLSSWCSLRPSELLLCFDKPAPLDCVTAARQIARAHDVPIRILEIERNPEYSFHQAWIRRTGFRSAKHDAILTGDIDLMVFPSCLKAIELVGKNNIGLVSLSKLRIRRNIMGAMRNIAEKTARKLARLLKPELAGQAYFTGLYAIHKPAWLDSEPLEGIKRLEDPKTAQLRLDSWGGYAGEDTFLRDWMIKKHRCLYLSDIGAVDTRLGLEDSRLIQYKIGMKFAYDKRGFKMLRHALIHIRPHVIVGYVHQRVTSDLE